MESGRIRVLATALGAVPGTNAHSGALLGMAAAVRAELDMVTLKIPNLPHQSQVGDARMFRVRVLGEAKQRRAIFSRAVRRQIEADHYDVVHARGPAEGTVVAQLRKPLGFRFIYEVATFADEAEGPEAEAEWRSAHLRCLEAADLIIVGAEAAARALGERGFGGKTAVVAPGVDVDAYDWWPSAPTAVTRLVYLGSFAPDREIPTLLGGIREVSRRIPVRALLAGDPDPDRRELVRTMADAFGIGDLVEIRGEPRAVSLPSLIAACDVAVVTASATPRFREHGDLPEPLLEYLACQRPVVAAGVPAVAEVVRDEREGLLYVPGDEATLADAVVSLAADPDASAGLARAGYRRVRSLFSSAARRRRIAEVYERLVPGSQQYDAWSEAFHEDGSGMLPIPSSMMPAPDSPGPSSIDREFTPADLSPARPSPRRDPRDPLERERTNPEAWVEEMEPTLTSVDKYPPDVAAAVLTPSPVSTPPRSAADTTPPGANDDPAGPDHRK